MVQIPTSRDVGRISTRSGRIAPSGPSVSVGAAVADAGQALTSVAFDLNALREQENLDRRNKAGFDLETKIAQFRDQEEQAFLKAREDSSESGIGFTRQFIEGYQQRADDFVKANFIGISEAQDAQSRQALLGLGNSLYGKAHQYEQVAKGNFYDRTTNQVLDTIRTQIRSNAAPYEELKRQGLAAIDSADMPEPWKAERRAMWDADAAESKWRWKFEQDPRAALSSITPDSASSLLRKEEGFRSEPYWDKTAWRIGYGSDTITLADGSHVPVRPGMKITREDAERDLAYRLSEREGAKAREQVGAQWGDLPGNVQAALASVAYNYGSLPKSVVKAVQSGDMNVVADSVEKLPANPERRKREAAIIRGGTPVPTEGDEFASIPYDRRQQLATWGQNQYNQQRTQERAAAKDYYSLLIATQPEQMSASDILGDSRIDNGDKAQLITSLRSAQKENAGVSHFIAALSNGDVPINPFDADQRKLADKAYEKMLASASPEQQAVVTSGFVASTGYIPEKVQAEVRRGAASTNPTDVAQAMEAASVLQKNAPISFGNFDGGGSVAKSLDLYNTYTRAMGYSPEDAARKIIASNDPEQIRRRDAILKSEPVKKLLKDQDANSVAAIFKGGFFSRAPKVGAAASEEQIRVGINPEAEAAIVADYRSVLEEALVDANGDQAVAEDIAKRRFQTVYGTTSFSPLAGNIVVRYPPEKAYPADPGGSHDYIRDQLVEAMKGEGIEADALYLQGDAATEQDIRAGKPPRYQVFYEKDGKLQRYNLPFYADADAAKDAYKVKQEQQIRDAEQQMLENRATEQQTYPEGRGQGRLERFGNDKLYRGIARENSPLGRAIQRQNEVRDRAAKAREADAAERRAFDNLSPEQQREQSMDDFLNSPFQSQGAR